MSVRLDDDAAGSRRTWRPARSTRHPGHLGHEGVPDAADGTARWYRTATARDRTVAPRIIAAMLLAIDIGNTNVTTRPRSGPATLVATRRAATTPRATRRRAGAAARGPARASTTRVRRRRGASRAPRSCRRSPARSRRIAARRERPLLVAAAGHRAASPSGWTGRARWARTGWSTPSPPQRLYGTPAVVVDFGTATTLDCVGGRRRIPGRRDRARARARARGARGADRQAAAGRAAQPDRAIGRDTVSAIQAGTVLGYQALATGLLARVRRELAEPPASSPARSGRS